MAAVGIEATISEALIKHLADLTLSPALPVSWPNVPFTPPTSGKYLHAHHLRGPTDAVGISAWNAHQGIFQVDVVHPATGGLIPPTNIADAVAAHFARGTRLANGEIEVRIDQPPQIAAPVTDAPYIRTPVSISYRVFTR